MQRKNSMKKFKIITSICLFSATIGLTSATLTGCSCSGSNGADDTPQSQYIADRTFSLLAVNSSYLVFGTGWIIDKPANANTYEYWLATNWHVTHGFEQLQNWNLFYADKSKANGEGIISEYNYEKINNFAIEDTNKFLFDDKATDYYIPAIDLSIIRVNFGSPRGAIKDKLDRLNNKKNADGYINKFVFDSQEIRNKQKYVAGYPMKEGSWRVRGGKWGAKTIPASNLRYIEYASQIIIGTKGHPIGNPKYNQQGHKIATGTEDFYYYDVAPQYMAINSYSDEFLGGGASGSMLITEDYEVCGIYWGIYTDATQHNARPSFSLLRTQKKDFLKDYISE